MLLHLVCFVVDVFQIRAIDSVHHERLVEPKTIFVFSLE